MEARKSYFVSTRATLQLPSGSRKRLPTELDPDGPTRLGIQADHEDQVNLNLQGIISVFSR